MAVLAGNKPTLLDHAKRIDPDGKIADVAELLSQQNEILDDMVFIEGNLITGHKVTVRTGLPDVFWRLLNAGVQPSKSRTAQIEEGCGMLEAWSEVDVEVAALNGNTNEFRLSEAFAFLEAMNQEAAQTLFYGNSSISPEEFNGFSIRYSSRSVLVPSSQNVIHGGGSGSDNSSIWLICWSPNTVFGIFPKGSKAGLDHEDYGKQVVENANGVTGALMTAYREKWTWKMGLVVKDWRYAVRICNIDISDLNTGSAADITNLMIKACHRIPIKKMGRCVFYMNRTVFEYLDIQRRDDVIAGGGLDYMHVDGEAKYSFRGIPVKICDALLETEATVV